VNYATKPAVRPLRSPLKLSLLFLSKYVMPPHLRLCRHVRRRHERRALQRPHFRAYTSTTRATDHRNRNGNRDGWAPEDERRFDDDGFPATTARHGTSRALRMSRADACGRVSLSALRRAALRCADRLRRLWLDDSIVTSSRTELSSLVSRQVLLDRVSR
jgi:hypothetical protein